jgi:hypothetical protein
MSGFKFKRIDLTAGSTDFPLNNTRNRCNSIVRLVAEALISMNIGWKLDSDGRSSDSQSTSDFADVPGPGSWSGPWPGLFLINEISGCKLFMCYYGHSNEHRFYLDYPYVVGTYAGSTPHGYMAGLIMSIIPANSTESFGSTFGADFIPSTATRAIGTCLFSSADSSHYTSFAHDPTSGYIYSWGIFANEYCIAVSTAKSTNGTPGTFGIPTFATGKILGTLANDTDNLCTAQYGSINFREIYAADHNEGLTSVLTQYTDMNGTNRYYVSKTILSHETGDSAYSFGQIFSALGSPLNLYNGGCLRITPSNVHLLSSTCFSTTGLNTRWLPYMVVYVASDLSTNGVVPGDGFKGYLDTDLFRCGAGNSVGQLFDNGNFLCLDNTNSFLIGWDPANTDSIAV